MHSTLSFCPCTTAKAPSCVDKNCWSPRRKFDNIRTKIKLDISWPQAPCTMYILRKDVKLCCQQKTGISNLLKYIVVFQFMTGCLSRWYLTTNGRGACTIEGNATMEYSSTRIHGKKIHPTSPTTGYLNDMLKGPFELGWKESEQCKCCTAPGDLATSEWGSPHLVQQSDRLSLFVLLLGCP